LHTLLGAGNIGSGSLDAANALKPALARGELSTIGATTLTEYRKHIENQDAALARRFRAVTVPPPSVPETVRILHGLRDSYEKHHCVRISDEALQSAAELSEKYITDRFLPDKAIDLMDEASSNLAMQEEARLKAEGVAPAPADSKEEEPPYDRWPLLSAEHIAQIISLNTGIPLSSLTEDESKRLLQMESQIHARVIGQRQAVSALARAIKRSRIGLKDPNRPQGVFLFLGPTGVGKTELVKALQHYQCGRETDLIRLDMSEYMERHAVATLIGAPPGYVGCHDGGKLTEAVRRKPYAVVLFDEIEKAHPDTYNILLQIFEDGRLTDRQGRTVDFKNTILIMTSNIGAVKIKNARGPELEQSVVYSVLQDVNRTFSPEFINRLDEIICFQKLTRDEVGQILDLMIEQVRHKLSPRRITLALDDSAKTFMLERGFDEDYGARPMRRAIQRHIEDPLTDALLSGEIEIGNRLMARCEGEKLVFDQLPEEVMILEDTEQPAIAYTVSEPVQSQGKGIGTLPIGSFSPLELDMEREKH